MPEEERKKITQGEIESAIMLCADVAETEGFEHQAGILRAYFKTAQKNYRELLEYRKNEPHQTRDR